MTIYFVAQRHPSASDSNPGTAGKPFLTINRAASVAAPGDTVHVLEGVYRERVNPKQGGEEGFPIAYVAEVGKVFLRGSEVFKPAWEQVSESVWRGSLASVRFGTEAYAGHLDESRYGRFNPYLWHFNRRRIARPHSDVVAGLEAALAEEDNKMSDIAPGEEMALSEAQTRRTDVEHELLKRTRASKKKYLTTLGQLFSDGVPLTEAESDEELALTPGSWMVSPDADSLLVHFPDPALHADAHYVEISVRHTVFSPVSRGLGHITVRGFIIEHAANHFPTWGESGWPQVGALSTRGGHHWIIEDNTIRYAKSLGIDCGSEGAMSTRENSDVADYLAEHDRQSTDTNGVGWHVIRNNRICDNGHCGIAGIRHTGTQVIGNLIERNNRDGRTSPWWEFAGIKFHFFFDGLIEGNLIRDNETHGIWIDNQWKGSRITRNVIVNNLWSGINVELGRGPVLIDNNVIAHTRQGDGIYGHDLADVTIAHNLLYANANFGAWFAFATPRVPPEDGCWDIHILNNLILGNRAGAVALPIPWQCAGNNICDANLLSGAGQYLDEGSGSRSPLFQITNETHMANMPQFFPEGFEAQTPDVVRAKFREALRASGLPESEQPDLTFWPPYYHVPFEVWQKGLGYDRASRVVSLIRDGMQSRVATFEVTLDDTIRQVACQSIKGVEQDFYGTPLPSRALPGPFQSIEPGRNRFRLWPVPGVRSTWPLP